VRLTVLGSNGTYPTPGRPASGYLVTGRVTIWMDAGPGTLVALLEMADLNEIDALVLSHGHADHCLDVIPLFNMLRYGIPRRNRLPVYAAEGVVDRLAAFVGAGPRHDFFQVFDFVTVGPGASASVGGLNLVWGAAVHSVPAVVTRMDADGKSLAYSGDTGPGGDLIEIASHADLLLCEATNQGSRSQDDYPYHLYAIEAAAAARDAGAGRLLVTHIAPTLDETASVAEAAAVFEGPVEWAAPGLEVEL